MSELHLSVVQLPLIQQIAPLTDVASWLVYCHPETRKRTFETWNIQVPLQPETHRYLESEFWWNGSIPIGDLVSLEQIERGYAYAYRLPPMSSFPEYWLLWTSNALNGRQQEEILKQGGLLRQLLELWQVLCQQQQTIQQLRQTMHRTQHQVRNPLALISLYSENLWHSLQNDSRQTEAEIIHETAIDLSQRLDNLLAFGNRSTAQLVDYDLRDIVIESLKLLAPLQNERQIQVVCAEHSIILSIDPWRMRQVLENLFSNAMYLNPIGGSIDVNWEIFRDEVLITVQDQGPGLSNLDMANLFTPCYSRRVGGQGLGLAIARQMVLEHQGQIWAENLPKGGTQFSIILPRSPRTCFKASSTKSKLQ
jgi:signal transduction histidine kinase